MHQNVQYILTQKKAITLFATHYHEMTGLDSKYVNLKNTHMSVYEGEGSIRFAYMLKEGPATKSYGIHVAEIAGVPLKVIQDAYRILDGLESREKADIVDSHASQLSLMDFSFSKEKEFIGKITRTDVNNLTPLQAMNLIAHWKEETAKLL